MPMNRTEYADDWKAISHRIRFERAGGKCEGCGAPHDAEIARSREDKTRFIVFDMQELMFRTPDGEPIRLSEIPDEYDTDHLIRVILTTAHLNHNTADNRDENLKAWCQLCHLRYDAKHHAENARRTRARNKRDAAENAGQMNLFGDIAS